jgi:NTP pyrophosphatase (non-canonical NTP hydrolase)
VAQTFETIAPYTLEEAFEVADAIERGDLGALREELGDLLFQVVFHARLAEERGAFVFAAVARGLPDEAPVLGSISARVPHTAGPTTTEGGTP